MAPATTRRGARAEQRAPDPELDPRYPPSPFPYGWFQMGLSRDLAPGEVKPLRYLARDFVLWRDEEGEAHLMDAHCAHLGAHLGHGGIVEGKGIRCPFHHWKYDASGRCVDVPYSDRVNRRACVRRHHLVERNGFLMLWWHPGGEPPLWEIPELPECASDEWTEPYVHEWHIDTHWQEMVENAVDTSHFHYVHGAAAVPKITLFEVDGPVLRCTADHLLQTPLGPREGYIDTIMYGPTWGTVRFVIHGITEILFPQALTPVEENHLHATFSFLSKGRGARTRLGRALADEVIRQIDADAPVWEHKLYRPRPSLIRGDGPVMPFREWASQFYVEPQDGAPAPGARASGANGSAGTSGGNGANGGNGSWSS